MKGQLIGIDFVPSLLIFIAIVIGLLFTWNNIVSQIDDVGVANDMERVAIDASDSLIKNRGAPSGWTASNVILLGLSDGPPNVLSENKVASLLTVDYMKAQELLGMPYNFSLEINKTNGDVFTANGNQTIYGFQPNGATDIAIVRRMIVMSGEAGVLTMKVWFR